MKTRGKNREKRHIFEGGLHFWLEKLFDAVVLNLLWLFCCLPLVTIGASCAAFYYAFVKVLRGERGYPFAEFWKSFRLNLAKGIQVWLIIGALLFLLAINRNIAADIGGPYVSLFFICLYSFLFVLIAAFALYAFSILSRFEMGVMQILKLSVYMCFRYFPYTLALLALTGAVVLAVYYLPFLILCVPVFWLYPFSRLMEKLLFRHTPLPENQEEDGEYKWYLNPARIDGAGDIK
jgi:uncharacterized membrane protein YesL